MEEPVLRKRKLTSQEIVQVGLGIQNVPISRPNSSVDLGRNGVTDSIGTLLALPSECNIEGDEFIFDGIQSCGEIVNGAECRPRTKPSHRHKSSIDGDDDDDGLNLQYVTKPRPRSRASPRSRSDTLVQPQHTDGNNDEMHGMPTGFEGYTCRANIDRVMPVGVEEIFLGLDQNGCAEPELNFREVPETPVTRKKVREIEKVLSQQPVNVDQLRKLAMSEGGLIHDKLRKRAWSKLLGIDKIPPLSPLTDKELEANSEYNQVVLDVNRSLKRFPPGIPYDQRVVLQDQLTRLIMRVIIKHPHLRYYQGYHDVAVTVLLVVGEEAAFPIMEKLSTGHLNECMAETMDKTSHLLNYIYPVMKRMHSKLYDFMERSGCGTLFCLPWYLTWFGHNLNHYTDVVRLYDYFMSTEKLLPLYLAAAIVVHRKDEIFNVECDMPYVHSLLSNIPESLPFEKLLKEATQLYKTYPPSSLEKEVNERTRLARMQMGGGDRTGVIRRPPLRSFLQFMPRYSLFLATATLVVGLYAYIRTASALEPEPDVLFPIR